MSHFNATVLGPLAFLALLPLIAYGADPDVPPADAPVALIGSQHLTFGQLPSSVQTDLAEHERRYQQQLQALAIEHKREEHAIVETHVNNFLDSKLMQEEAAAHHETLEQLIKNVKNPPVTDADIRAFYEQHQGQIKQPFNEALIPITEYLMQQSAEEGKRTYLAALRAKYAARVTLEPLREEVAAEGPARGPKDARVTVIEFADFQCPYCRQMAPLLRQALAQYPHDLRLVYRQMPLTDIHPDALAAAAASVCAQQQGKFWEMHDALFADPPALDTAALKRTAERLQLQAKPFDECLESKATTAAIQADASAGAQLAVSGTPGLFINGRFFNGAISYEQLTSVIDDELQRAQPQRLASGGPN